MSVCQVLSSKWRIESQAWCRIKYDINEKFWMNLKTAPVWSWHQYDHSACHSHFLDEFDTNKDKDEVEPFWKENVHSLFNFPKTFLKNALYSPILFYGLHATIVTMVKPLNFFFSHQIKRSPPLQAAPCWGKIAIDPQNIHHHHLSNFFIQFFILFYLF